MLNDIFSLNSISTDLHFDYDSLARFKLLACRKRCLNVWQLVKVFKSLKPSGIETAVGMF